MSACPALMLFEAADNEGVWDARKGRYSFSKSHTFCPGALHRRQLVQRQFFFFSAILYIFLTRGESSWDQFWVLSEKIIFDAKLIKFYRKHDEFLRHC